MFGFGFNGFGVPVDLLQQAQQPKRSYAAPEEEALPAVLDPSNPFGQADAGKEIWSEDGRYRREAQFSCADALLKLPKERLVTLTLAGKLSLPFVEQFLLDYVRETGSAAQPENHHLTARLELIEPVLMEGKAYLSKCVIAFNKAQLPGSVELGDGKALSRRAAVALLKIYDFVGCSDSLFLRVQRLWSQTPQNHASSAFERAVIDHYGFTLAQSSEGRQWTLCLIKMAGQQADQATSYALHYRWSGRYSKAASGTSIQELKGEDGCFEASYTVSVDGKGEFKGSVQVPHTQFMQALKGKC